MNTSSLLMGSRTENLFARNKVIIEQSSCERGKIQDKGALFKIYYLSGAKVDVQGSL